MLTCNHFIFEFSIRKKIWGSFTKCCEKNVLCKKGDEITRFDGTATGLIVDEVCEVLAALLRLQHHLVLQAGLAHPQLHATPPLVTQQQQSRQSAKLFLQSPELGLPQPLTRRFWGEGHTCWQERGGWESYNSDEGTYTVVLFIYTYFVLNSIKITKLFSV
jgi:hypothetical protein